MKISWRGLYNKHTPFKVRRFCAALVVGCGTITPVLSDSPHTLRAVMWITAVATVVCNMVVESSNGDTNKP